MKPNTKIRLLFTLNNLWFLLFGAYLGFLWGAEKSMGLWFVPVMAFHFGFTNYANDKILKDKPLTSPDKL